MYPCGAVAGGALAAFGLRPPAEAARPLRPAYPRHCAGTQYDQRRQFPAGHLIIIIARIGSRVSAAYGVQLIIAKRAYPRWIDLVHGVPPGLVIVAMTALSPGRPQGFKRSRRVHGPI